MLDTGYVGIGRFSSPFIWFMLFNVLVLILEVLVQCLMEQANYVIFYLLMANECSLRD